jgi:hypothetical protein
VQESKSNPRINCISSSIFGGGIDDRHGRVQALNSDSDKAIM